MEEHKSQVRELYQLCTDQSQVQQNPGQITVLAQQILENPESTIEMKEVATAAEAYRDAILTSVGLGGPYAAVGYPITTYHPNLESARLLDAYDRFQKSLGEDDEDSRVKWDKTK